MCPIFYQEKIEYVWSLFYCNTENSAKESKATAQIFQLFHKFLRPSESILPSDALKGIPLSAKWVQCAAVIIIHSLIIDPPQICFQKWFPLKQNEYSYTKIQQTKMLVTCQRFGNLFLFGLVWQYSTNHKNVIKIGSKSWQLTSDRPK